MATEFAHQVSPLYDQLSDNNPVLLALQALRDGKPVIVQDAEDRENEADLIALGDRVCTEWVNFMITHGKGLICAPISREIARRLGLSLMVKRNTDRHHTQFTVSVDSVLCTTGISASERAHTIRALASVKARAQDFRKPGHIFPLIADPDGVLGRSGHTEAAVDLARLAGVNEVGVICEILDSYGSPITGSAVDEFASRFGLLKLTIQDIVNYRMTHERLLDRIEESPIKSKHGPFSVIRYAEDSSAREHLALINGSARDSETPLVAVHSACARGGIFGSLECDCNWRLNKSMELLGSSPFGVLLYLSDRTGSVIHPSCGSDLNSTQSDIGPLISKDLGIRKIRLLANDSKRISDFRRHGIEVLDFISPCVNEQTSRISSLKPDLRFMARLMELSI